MKFTTEHYADVCHLAKSVATAGDTLQQSLQQQHEANERVEKSHTSYQEALEALRSVLVEGDRKNFLEGVTEPSTESDGYVINHQTDVNDNSIDNLQVASGIKERVLKCLDRVAPGVEWGNLKDELDSLDTIELVMDLEDEFDIEIPDQNAERFWRSKRRISVDDLSERLSVWIKDRH